MRLVNEYLALSLVRLDTSSSMCLVSVVFSCTIIISAHLVLTLLLSVSMGWQVRGIQVYFILLLDVNTSRYSSSDPEETTQKFDLLKVQLFVIALSLPRTTKLNSNASVQLSGSFMLISCHGSLIVDKDEFHNRSLALY